MYMSNFQIGIQDFGFFTKFSYGSNPVELFLNYRMLILFPSTRSLNVIIF